MKIKPSKEQTVKSVSVLVPQYTELLHDLQKGNNRLVFSPEIFRIQNNIGQYVLMYDDERKIPRALFLYLLGEKGFAEYIDEINSLSETEQLELVEENATYNEDDLEEIFSDFYIPSTKQEWKESNEAFQQLPEDQQQEAKTRATCLWAFMFSSFFNTLSLVVHGSKLTSLVPQALSGDDEAFLKAIQIDRMLLLHHPYFKERKLTAQCEGDSDFLQKISYRESNPPMRGKIQYPALYMLFGALEAFKWLDDLSNEEINDICDEAKLDRWQKKIDDPNYITKMRINYRHYQKTGGVSMHLN